MADKQDNAKKCDVLGAQYITDEKNGDYLLIKVAMDPRASYSGKSVTLGSSGGFVDTEAEFDGETVQVSVNVICDPTAEFAEDCAANAAAREEEKRTGKVKQPKTRAKVGGLNLTQLAAPVPLAAGVVQPPAPAQTPAPAHSGAARRRNGR